MIDRATQGPRNTFQLYLLWKIPRIHFSILLPKEKTLPIVLNISICRNMDTGF